MIRTISPQKAAIITKDKTYSYTELLSGIQTLANLFSGKNYQKVAICSENRADWIYAFYAIWQNHGTVVTIDFLSSPDDIHFILNDCRPELLFVSETTIETINKAKEGLSYDPEVVIFEEVKYSEEPASTAFHCKSEDEPESTAVIIYTSGTTGSPKGVMLSFNNLISNIRAVSEEVKIFRTDRQVLMLLPLHHIFPMIGSMAAPLYVGSSIVMSPSMQSTDLIETLKNNNVSIMIGVPRLYELLYKGLKSKIESSAIGKLMLKAVAGIGSRKLAKKIFKKVHVAMGGHLDFMISGGAKLPEDAGKFFTHLGFEVLEGYGMTEAAPMITFTRPGHVRIGSAGQALPGVKIDIQNGEIVVKGPNVMQGYFNRTEETNDILKNGWLYTGDLGEIDKDGFLYITGRKKEIIVLQSGKNINPLEIEFKLENQYEAVKEAGVFSDKDKLYAVIHPDMAYLEANNILDINTYFKEEVIPPFNQTLTSYKRIMNFSLAEDVLPRTRLGKLQRFKLPDIYEKKVSKKRKISKNDASKEYLAIKTFIESQTDMSISPEDHLTFDIAMDSLGRIGLIDFIQRTFGVEIDEEKLLSFPTVQKIVEHVKQNKLFQKPTETFQWSSSLKEKISVRFPKTWGTLSLIKHIGKGLLMILFKVRRKGMEHIPEGPAILAPNHQSYLDGLLVITCIKNAMLKKTYFYAKKEYVSNRFMSFIAKHHNVVVMDLQNNLKESIQKLAEILKQGNKVLIFPEGTRSYDQNLGDFKQTFALLSKELGVPVIPVAISGANKAMPRGRFFPRFFKTIHVEFLPLLHPEKNTAEGITAKTKEMILEKIV